MMKSILLIVVVVALFLNVSAQSGPGVLPDPSLTPGAAFNVDSSTVCQPGYSKGVRNVPDSEKKQVYDEYGVQDHQGYCDCSEGCEIDHLISLEIGGSNDITNLWPQPYCGTWNAHMKDRLENFFHDQMCSGAQTMSDVQSQISSNWISAYNQYIGQIHELEYKQGLAEYDPTAPIPTINSAPTLPDSSLTPGAAFDVDTATVCKSGYSKGVRNVPSSEKKKVYGEYHVLNHQGYCDCSQGCEVDHLISLEIGGSNDITNLWPQPYCGTWNAHMKDRLENYFHKQMCNGAMTMADVQKQISTNWITAYTKYLSKMDEMDATEGVDIPNGPDAPLPNVVDQ